MQGRVDGRLQGWTEDLERAQATLDGSWSADAAPRAADLRGRDADRDGDGAARAPTPSSSGSRSAGCGTSSTAAQEAVAAANEELESHAAERRRALQELAERLRRREPS